MENKTNTIFVQKYQYKDTRDLLNEILKRLETFHHLNGYSPKNLKITAKMYYDIRAYNKSLIKFIKGDGAYILGMKVVF